MNYRQGRGGQVGQVETFTYQAHLPYLPHLRKDQTGTWTTVLALRWP